MDKYLKNNKDLWNELTPIHQKSEFYNVEGFKKGRCTLKSIELEEVGDVTGKSLLHLMCHFGLDTLSWGRLGAKATGVDFSEDAINLARSLSKETGIKADFICSDIYALPEVLKGKFDIVFTSAGVLVWLSDLKKWVEIITHFLKPGGFFYIMEFHPIEYLFENSPDCKELEVVRSYFHAGEPFAFDGGPDYADPAISATHGSYEWPHSLGEVVTALSAAGLRVDFLHEFPACRYKAMPFMKQDKGGWWRITGDLIPLMFSLKASKP